MKKIAVAIVLVVCALGLGCATKYPTAPLRMTDVTVQMDKSQVRAVLGAPYGVVGSKRFENGVVEIWEYRGNLGVPQIQIYV